MLSSLAAPPALADAPLPAATPSGTVQAAQSVAEHPFDIAPQALAPALLRFTEVTGIQLFFDAALARNLTSPGIRGTRTAEAALSALLAGTGLTYRFTNPATVTLARLPQSGAAGAIELEPVRVEGTAARSDPGSTEFTRSYGGTAVTVGTKLPTALKDVPQSVTVVSRQRMDDQNLTTLEDVMAQTTGVQLRRSTNDVAFFHMRGYQLDYVQLDGMPVPTGQRSTRLPTGLDMAAYDRVEVLRGPAGLFQGAGEPAGVVNLVRKRPLDQFSVGGASSIGSWDFYRLEADVTGPLVESGRVRGRLIGLYEDRGFFYDEAQQRKPMIYGTVDIDLDAETTLSLSSAYQEVDGMPMGGLPTDKDGNFLALPRSTYLDADWARSDTATTDLFAALEHRLGNGGQARLAGRYVDRSYDLKRLFNTTAVDPAIGTTPLRGQNIAADEQDLSLDGYLSSPFTLFGQTHGVVAGFNYLRSDFRQKAGAVATPYVQDVFDPRHDFPELAVPFDSFARQRQTQYGPYAQLRARPIDWMTVVLGARLTWVEQTNRTANNTGTVTQAGDYAIDHEFTPYAALLFTLTPQLTLYGSHAAIFTPQTVTDPKGAMLPPRKGTQQEIGLKGTFLGGRLNAHVAAFRIRDRNRAVLITDPAEAEGNDDCFTLGCYKVADRVETRGVEVEASGEILPGWNLFAGYAYTDTAYTAGLNSGLPFSTYLPKHNFVLWSNYELPDGRLAGLSFGGGVRAMSGFDYEAGGAVRPSQGAYAVVGAQIGYRVNDAVSLMLTGDNLFDKTYYERANGAIDGNRYGEPRSVMLTARARW